MSDNTTPTSFDIADVIAIPAPVTRTETKTFQGAGRDWEVTVKADATKDPEAMYKLVRMLATEYKPRAIVVPGQTPFQLTDSRYIGMLEVLRVLSVSPAWNVQDGVDRWAALGQRIGGPAMDKILTWMLDVAGLSVRHNEEEKSAAGEATAQAE